MKSESLMWRKIRPVLVAAKLDPVRVENPIHPGTPDVNLASGFWVELKCIPSWPAREMSKVSIPHYTPQQRVWLYRRWKYAPGTTFLLLEVITAHQWLLFDGNVAAKGVGKMPAVWHRSNARAVFGDHELDVLSKHLVAAPIDHPREEISTEVTRT
jgi:Mesyanzhinovviridae DNA helicase